MIESVGWARNSHHIRFVDRLEPADAGAVETDAGDERVLVDRTGGDARMLPRPRHVDETEVNHLDAVFLDEL